MLAPRAPDGLSPLAPEAPKKITEVIVVGAIEHYKCEQAYILREGEVPTLKQLTLIAESVCNPQYPPGCSRSSAVGLWALTPLHNRDNESEHEKYASLDLDI